MPVAGAIPEWLLYGAAFATVFTVMFDLGLAIVPGDFRWAVARPGMMLKSLFPTLIAVPALAWIVARALDLPRAAEVGIMLMAIAPGAPVALRRSLGAGGHRSFALALQIALSALAVVSMPLWIAAFDEYYGVSATIDPRELARQVFTAQLLPLLLGMTTRRLLAARAAWLEPVFRRLASVLLILLVALVLVDIWQVVIGAGLRVTAAIVIVTLLGLAVGHLLGGPDPATRTATAISSATRNAGLALLVATLNDVSPAVEATVLAYLVIAAVTVIPYAAWRRRAALSAADRG